MTDNGHTSRDLGRERDLTARAADTQNVKADVLNAFAELRAGDGPVRERALRDFGLEVVEELADARNYCVWWLDQIAVAASGSVDELPGEITEQIALSLAAVTVAFHHADRAKQLHAKWRASR